MMKHTSEDGSLPERTSTDNPFPRTRLRGNDRGGWDARVGPDLGGAMTVKVVLSTGTSLQRTGGEKEFEVDARNLRGVIKAMDARFPGLGEYLEEETTVAIDGELHETAWFQPLRENAEVYFLPKIEAG